MNITIFTFANNTDDPVVVEGHLTNGEITAHANNNFTGGGQYGRVRTRRDGDRVMLYLHPLDDDGNITGGGDYIAYVKHSTTIKATR